MKQLDDNEWLGFFCLPEDREREVPGLLQVHNHTPTLILSGELAPWSQGRIPIVHGALMGSPQAVTLFDVVIQSQAGSGVFENDVELVQQGLRAAWLVYGAQLTEKDRVTHAFVHLSGLDAWAQAPVASLESSRGHAEEQQEIENLDAPVAGPLPGTVRLTFPGERRYEAHQESVVRRTQLEWTGREAMPLRQVTQHFAVHLQEFFSLVRMDRAVIDRYRVLIADGPEQSLEVDGWMVDDPLGDQRHDGMAARRDESGVQPIATWLERHSCLGRAPGTTASILARGKYGERFVDAEFTTMVMALEGLHRKLNPKKSGDLTKAQARTVRRVISRIITRAEEEGDIDDLMASFLQEHVFIGQSSQPTLDQRIQDILDDVRPLVPMICGTAPEAQSLWKKAVKDLRNNYAHGLEKQTEIAQTRVLVASLTVLVAARCLKHVGYSPERLAESIPHTKGGGNLVYWGRTLMPDLYAPGDSTSSADQAAPSDEDTPGAEN